MKKNEISANFFEAVGDCMQLEKTWEGGGGLNQGKAASSLSLLYVQSASFVPNTQCIEQKESVTTGATDTHSRAAELLSFPCFPFSC